ncbi:uncharacterized protein V1510DRAFT_417300 [Dipodascopsis tothii]|uniref:uncharacterized protein n=1 Tax=Dipodascopsis tothii TaxID=44089 RepID=UPI0034CFF3C9
MFGAICAGRPVQTNVQQVDGDKYVLEIEDGARVNHIVVFLLPGAAMDPSVAATVYFQWPGRPFKLLGAISNNKPSAIFRVNQAPAGGSADADEMIDDAAPPVTISLGISLEPAAAVEAQLAQLQAPSTALVRAARPAPDPNSTAALAGKIMNHAFNFLSGFATPDGMISLKAFGDWWSKFQGKLAVDPQFLDRISD